MSNSNNGFGRTANIFSIVIIFIFIIIFAIQYNPPYTFDGFSRDDDNVAEGISFLDCEKDNRYFIDFFVNFFSSFTCPIENLINLFIILSVIYIFVFRIQSIRRSLKKRKIRRDISNLENTVKKLDGIQIDNHELQRVTDEIHLIKAETLTTKSRRTVFAEIADILSFILAFWIFLSSIVQKKW